MTILWLCIHHRHLLVDWLAIDVIDLLPIRIEHWSHLRLYHAGLLLALVDRIAHSNSRLMLICGGEWRIRVLVFVFLILLFVRFADGRDG